MATETLLDTGRGGTGRGGTVERIGPDFRARRLLGAGFRWLGLPGSSGQESATPVFASALTVAFLVFVSLQLFRHQMWSDELNAWGLVLASPTLPALFHNLHYEGHPGLWHLLLWGASFTTSSPVAIQVVHAAIATGVAALIAFASPFSRVEKVLLLLNYFVLYEFAVVSRNYGIGLLLALGYAHLRATRPGLLAVNGVLLGLLANTNVFGLILSCAFAAEYLLDRARHHHGSFGSFLGPAAPAACAYLALFGLAIATLVPAPDISWRTTGTPLSAPFDLYELKKILLAYWEMPLVPAMYRIGWQPREAGLLKQLLDPALIALPFVIAAVLYQFRRCKTVLVFIGLTAIVSAAFGHLVYFGYMRHWGINFVAVLAALWMQRIWLGRQRSLLVLGFLAIGALTGLGASARVWMLPFSYAQATARWIETHAPADVALVGTADNVVAAVAIELHRPIYFLDCSCTDTFLRYQRRRDAFDSTQIPARLATAVRELRGRPVMLITNNPVGPDHVQEIAALGLTLSPAAEFVGSQIKEDFYVYRVAAR